MISHLVTGVRVEPTAEEIIRTAGIYDKGVCLPPIVEDEAEEPVDETEEAGGDTEEIVSDAEETVDESEASAG